MRVIHEVPAPLELANMVRSFLYFHIYRKSVNCLIEVATTRGTNLDCVIGLEGSAEFELK